MTSVLDLLDTLTVVTRMRRLAHPCPCQNLSLTMMMMMMAYQD